jgi:hypothetical protein
VAERFKAPVLKINLGQYRFCSKTAKTPAL